MDRLPQFLRRLRNLLVRRGRSREDAEDLIQEACLRTLDTDPQGPRRALTHSSIEWLRFSFFRRV